MKEHYLVGSDQLRRNSYNLITGDFSVLKTVVLTRLLAIMIR